MPRINGGGPFFTFFEITPKYVPRRRQEETFLSRDFHFFCLIESSHQMMYAYREPAAAYEWIHVDGFGSVVDRFSIPAKTPTLISGCLLKWAAQERIHWFVGFNLFCIPKRTTDRTVGKLVGSISRSKQITHGISHPPPPQRLKERNKEWLFEYHYSSPPKAAQTRLLPKNALLKCTFAAQ